MTVYLRDEFTDPNGTQLDDHTPAPIAGGGAVWEYIEAGAAPYAIDSNAVRDEGTGVANPARVLQVILDDLIEVTGNFQMAGPLTAAQTGQLHICMVETAISAILGRITGQISEFGIGIKVVDDVGVFRDSISTLTSRDLEIPFEMGINKVGTRIEAWIQDVGGGNRESNLLTLTSIEQDLYEDGAHRMVGISCTGISGGHYRCDFVQAEDFVPAAISQTADIDYELVVPIPVSEAVVVDWEQILRIPVSQSEIIDYELGAPLVFVSQQAVIDHEVSILRKLFCPEPAPASIVTTCPVARTIKCIREDS